MNTISFSININAPKERVWEKLWSEEGYRQWTAPFMQGSYAESNWREGSEIKFLAPDGSGMYSIIKKLVLNQEMVFEHHGELKNGKKEEKEWKGANESYFLSSEGNGTRLDVHMDISGDFEQYFRDTFPKALQLVKEISEA